VRLCGEVKVALSLLGLICLSFSALRQDNPSLPAAAPTTGGEDLARLRAEIKMVEALSAAGA
jgi:hypothetical protein